MFYLLVPLGIPCKSVAERARGKQCENYAVFGLFALEEGKKGDFNFLLQIAQ
jgi:hypothetical protein